MERRSFLKTIGYGMAALLSGCATSKEPAARSGVRRTTSGKTRTIVGRSAPVKSRRRKKAAPTAQKPRPNILWLISEDTSPDMACYGNTVVKTPNIDRLAREGARFTNAFVTAPVCSASRSAFMTGMYQTTIGAHNHRSHRSDGYKLTPPVTVITELFRRAGYFTANCAGLSYKKPGKTDWNFTPNVKAFDGTDWSQHRPGQPFFAQINFNMTHRNFQRDKNNPIDPANVELPPYYPDHPVTRRDWADYLESIQVLDNEIGVALQWLEKEGAADNTIIMYFGDNGRPHVRGKQWLYEGGIHVPMIIRWPGHVEPGTVVEDLVSSIDFAPTFLSMIGIEPPEQLQGHIVFGPEKQTRKYVVAARDRCDETVDRIRCVRSQRYKYIRNYHPDRPYIQFNAYKKLQYPALTVMQVLHAQGKLTPDQAKFMAPNRPKEELYDLQNDPHELHNLAEDRKLRKVLREHRAKLDEWVKATADKGEVPEDPQTVAYWQDDAAKSYKQQMEQRGLSAETSDEDYLKWWEQKLLG